MQLGSAFKAVTPKLSQKAGKPINQPSSLEILPTPQVKAAGERDSKLGLGK